MQPILFDTPFLTRLEQLQLLSRRLFHGRHQAMRRSRQTGSSMEFADYRNYTPGDDLRAVDWNVFGRLDRMFVKLFEAEQDLHITLLLDTSASMRWTPPEGQGRLTKDYFARRIAAALGYLSLANLDRVNIIPFPDGARGELGFKRGKESFHSVLKYLRELTPGEESRLLSDPLRTISRRMKTRGLIIVLSDFLYRDAAEALSLLRQQQFDVTAIQILDPLELDPSSLLAGGDLRLRDSETGVSLDTLGDPATLRQYVKAFSDFIHGLETACRQRNISFLQTTTEIPFEDLILKALREKQVLR